MCSKVDPRRVELVAVSGCPGPWTTCLSQSAWTSVRRPVHRTAAARIAPPAWSAAAPHQAGWETRAERREMHVLARPACPWGVTGAARHVQRQDQATPYSPCMTSPSRRLFPSSSWMIRACVPPPSCPIRDARLASLALPCPFARALSHTFLSVRFMPCVCCVSRQLPAAAVPSSVLCLSVCVRECAGVGINQQFTLASVVGRPTCVALTENGAIVGKRAEVSLDHTKNNNRDFNFGIFLL